MKTQREVIDAITEHSMAVLRGEEEENVQGLAQAFYDAQEEIIARIRAAFPGEMWTLDQMQGARGQALFQQIQDQLNKLNAQLNAGTEQATFDQVQGARQWTAYLLDQATPPTVYPHMPYLPENTIRALVNSPFQGAMFSQRYGLMSDQMAADIRGELTQSMINGESMDDAAARIEGLVGSNEDYEAINGYADRALTIARTEIMRAQEIGKDLTYDSNQDLMADDPTWVATAGDRLCPWCLRRDGKTDSEIEEQEAPEADPWGNSSTRPLHPRCRCTSIPTLKSWADLGIDMPEDAGDTERGMRNEDGDWVIQPVDQFEDWKQGRAQQLGVAL